MEDHRKSKPLIVEGQDHRRRARSAVGARHKVPNPRLALVSLRATPASKLAVCQRVPVIGGKKSHCIVYKRQSVFYALLRRFYYALGNHFAHWRAPIFPLEHSVPSPWCHAKQSASRRPEEDTAGQQTAKRSSSHAAAHLSNVYANPQPASLAMFQVHSRSGWAGRPKAARCAFMRLISLGFRSLRAILRS